MSEVKTGTLRHDPELRFTNSGLPMLTFDLIEHGTGELIHCIAWRDLAESIANDDTYFNTRDALISVRGYFKDYTYNTREGKRTVNQLIIKNIWHKALPGGGRAVP